MIACQSCGSPLSDRPADADPAASEGPRSDVARVASVAEAGYLVSLLESVGIAAGVRPIETFDAVHGAWRSTQIVSVPEADRDRAAATLHAEAAGAISEGALEMAVGEDAVPQASVNPWWMLTVLAVVAAAGTSLAVDRFGEGPRQRRAVDRRIANPNRAQAEPVANLASALREQRGVFYSSGDPNGSRRRLSYSPVHGAWVLSIDADGDGRFESSRRFVEPAPVAADAAAG